MMEEIYDSKIDIFEGIVALSVFPQKCLRKCEDTYLILQNKYLCIFKHSFGAKILRPKLKKVFVYILKKIC